ncbi:UNVERIFIED_CONTAM: putative membrane protein YkvI [Brevibacillus sp. OAP136]
MNRTAWQIAVISAASALGGTYLFGGEWLRFFSYFGSWGTIGIVLVTLGFVWLTAKIVLLIRDTGLQSHRQFLFHLFGERAAPALSSTLALLLLIYVGSLLQEYAKAAQGTLSLPMLAGMLVCAALSFAFLRSKGSTVFAGSIIALAMSALLLGLVFSLQHYVPLPPLTYQLNISWLWHAIFFVCLHALLLFSAFLPTHSTEDTSVSTPVVYLGAAFGGMIILTISLIGHFAILAHWHDAHSLENPLLEILTNRSPLLLYPYLLVALWQVSLVASMLIRSVCEPLLQSSELRPLPLQLLFLGLVVLIAFGGSIVPHFSVYVELLLRLIGFTILVRLIQQKFAKRP